MFSVHKEIIDNLSDNNDEMTLEENVILISQ